MRVLISGYYGFGNIGDEAILATLVSVLRERRPDMQICVLSAKPEHTATAYQVQAAPRWDLRSIWRELKAADLFISGGGGLLQDTTSLLSPLYYLGLMRLARAAGTPYVILGQGLGPLRRSLVRWAARRCLSRAAAITVRDAESLDVARSLGVTGEINVTCDPAILLQPAEPASIQALLAGHGVNTARPLVGITVRVWPHIESVTDAIVPLLQAARDQWEAEILLIPFQPPGDVALAWRLAAESKVPVILLDQLSDPRQCVGHRPCLRPQSARFRRAGRPTRLFLGRTAT